MGRLPLWRKVASIPQVTFFKPAGVPLANLEEVTLTVEEAESLRLKDLEGLEQEACAEKMHVSRSTFARVLTSARRKVAQALLNGKAIRIEGGNFELAFRSFRCMNGHEWKIPFEVFTRSQPKECPTCRTLSFMPLFPPGYQRKRRHGLNR